MLVALGQWLLQTPRRAWFTAGLIAPLPLIGWFSAVILAMVTLRRGLRAGALVAAAAALPFAIWLATHDGLSIYVLLKLASFALIWLVAGVMRVTRSWYAALICITFVGVVAVMGLHLAVADTHVFWQERITQTVDQMLGHANAQNNTVLLAGLKYYAAILQDKNVLHYLASIATGLFVVNVLMGSLGNS